MDKRDDGLDAALQGIDQERRATLRRLIVKGAFATPIVASFAMSGLTVERAAAASNTTGSGVHPSDRRLKRDVTRIAQHPAGFGVYRFKYLWSDAEFVGVMAEEVADIMPEAVTRGADGFLRVDYSVIGMRMESYATSRPY
jgi:hypothetical protein